jgi:hypothetical protein
MSQLCELGGSVIDRAPIKGYPTSSMNLEELESISSQTASPEEVHHSLEEFRAIDLKNRESRSTKSLFSRSTGRARNVIFKAREM